MSLLADFHFLRPAWLIALALLPLAWWVWRRVRTDGGNWQAVVDAHLLRHLVEDSSERHGRGGAWLAGVIWLLACVALAGPSWERESLPLYRNEAARVLAIELAPTMLAADVKPTRLARARFKLNDILAASRDMQTALIGYSGDAFVAAPLTDDVNTVRNLIDALDPGIMPVVGNNADRAIAEAKKLIEQAGLDRGELILIADSANERAIAAARAAHADGLTISVLGVGSNAGAPVPLPQGGFLQDAQGNIVLPRLDETSLRALAQAGGGRFAAMTADRADLEHLLPTRTTDSGTARAPTEQGSSERFRDRGPWVVLLLLPLVLMAFRRGWLLVLALCFCAPAPPAQAMEWMDLWQRPDQRAAQALKEGDAARAQELAKDPQWRGSAAYRAGDFAAAGEAFAKASGAQALYNQGNALARAGEYEGAIDAYARALAEEPGMADAEANKKAVEEWLKRQREQQQKNQSQKNQSQNQQDKNSQQNGDNSQSSDAQQGDSGQDRQSPEQNAAEDQQKGENSKEDQASKDPSRASSEDEKQQPSKDDSGKPEDSSSRTDADKDASPARAQDAAEADEQRRQQQQAMSQAIDQALEQKPQGEQEQRPVADAQDQAAQEQQQALEQWLQRVPDDPGGLLRRKFQLEYERRQREGGGR